MTAEPVLEKHFPEWMKLKEDIHFAGKIRSFEERDIWWIAIGDNVGVEINGKSKKFSRPILVYKKFSRLGFFGIPLTSQPHDEPFYASAEFQGKMQYFALAQARTMSVHRLYGERVGQLSPADFKRVVRAFEKLYSHEEKI